MSTKQLYKVLVDGCCDRILYKRYVICAANDPKCCCPGSAPLPMNPMAAPHSYQPPYGRPPPTTGPPMGNATPPLGPKTDGKEISILTPYS